MNVKVEIDWYRHALSCANVMHERGVGGGVRQIGIRDPDLTLRGYQQARASRGCIKDFQQNYDIICCSRMCRAIETAVGLFGNLKTKYIYVLPYISEKRRIFNIDKQNEPQSKDVARAQATAFLKWANSFYPEKDVANLIWVEEPSWPQSYGVPNPDYFYNRVLTTLISKFIERNPEQRTVRVAIVSHGRFIRETLKLRKCMEDLNWVRRNKKPRYCTSLCCYVPEFTPKYSNANTSCWRETREFHCKTRGICDYSRRTRIDFVYSPEPKGVFDHDLNWRDVVNCPPSVQRLFKDRRLDV